MKIKIKDEYYETFLKMIYIATYVISSSNDKKVMEEAEDIEQEILSFSTSIDKKKIVEYDNELKHFFLKEEYVENEIDKIIEEYNDEVFWNELIFSLAERDLVEKYGIENLRKMKEVEFIDKRLTLAQFYEEEFNKNGIKNLKISKEIN